VKDGMDVINRVARISF
jgi:hypothetical protein